MVERAFSAFGFEDETEKGRAQLIDALTAALDPKDEAMISAVRLARGEALIRGQDQAVAIILALREMAKGDTQNG